ncbi:DUF5615 family PIN-like protein [Candidatus Daviesbacteria bacterium]|nr:DUF5615 family PIN-like protein [Candidatus Daviesbacteria bacterium]
MKFLADEDFPKPLVTKIRKLGFSVKTIQQQNLQGSSDKTVAGMALKEKRIVLSFDKDFLKNQPKNLQVVIFSFPKIPTLKVNLLIEFFLKDLKQKLIRSNVLKFSKNGLEVVPVE